MSSDVDFGSITPEDFVAHHMDATAEVSFGGHCGEWQWCGSCDYRHDSRGARTPRWGKPRT